MLTSKRTYYGIILMGWGVYLLHAFFYRGWVVDDAAISATYARNLAQGLGLVSQPGMPPVEAYSNPTWVALLTPWFWVDLFDLWVVPKLLAAACMLITFGLLAQILTKYFEASTWGVAWVLGLLAVNGPFVCWLNCGLENPLYAMMITLHLSLTLQLWQADFLKDSLLFWAGLTASLLTLTRPDGLLFCLIMPLALLMRSGKFKVKSDRLAIWGLGWLSLTLLYMVLRRQYFESPWATPFLAKQSLDPTWLFDYKKWHNLFRSVAGPLGGIIPLLLSFGILRLLWFGAWTRLAGVWFSHLLAGICIFLLLPYDHLGWYRYATPFLLLIYPSFWVLGQTLWPTLPTKWRRPRNAFILAGALWIATAAMGGTVTFRRVSAPPVGVEEVAQRYAYPFNQLAATARLDTFSTFIPDAGAPLWYSKGKVYDCLGLLDTILVRTFKRDTMRYRDYVLQELQPTFIGLHGAWLPEVELVNYPPFHTHYQLLDSTFQPGPRQPKVSIYARRLPEIPDWSPLWKGIKEQVR